MLSDIIQYSFKNLSERKLRSFLTMLGIIVGIASVVALISLGNGLREALIGQFGGVSADVITVQAGGVAAGGPPGTGVQDPLLDDFVEDISDLDGVDVAIGRVIASMRMEFNDIQDINFAGSVPEGEAGVALEEILAIDAKHGRLLKDGDTNKIVLGFNYLDDANDFGRSIIVGDRVLLNNRTFEVVGILEKKGSFIFDNIILINEDVMRELIDDFDTVDTIAVRAKSLNDVDRAKLAIEKYMRDERDVKEGEEDFRVQTAGSLLSTIDSILAGVQVFIVVVASISMIVGCIGIINTMFTAVLERRKEIGIMKAIGAKNSDIFLLFFVESGFIGAVGGTIGIILGVIISVLGTNVLTAALGVIGSADISIPLLAGSLIGSFVIGSLAGILPAIQAAKLPPVQALKSDD